MPDSQSIRQIGSIDAAITAIRLARDNGIQRLLTDVGLDEFLETHFAVFAISKVKREFINRDLLSLKNSTLDLVHYAELIKSAKDISGEIAFEQELFLKELFAIFSKYGFVK